MRSQDSSILGREERQRADFFFVERSMVEYLNVYGDGIYLMGDDVMRFLVAALTRLLPAPAARRRGARTAAAASWLLLVAVCLI